MNTILALTLFLLFAATASAVAGDIRSIELRRLFQPTEKELSAETQGKVYIYDGLSDADIQRAMDEEFDRIDSMMFIRTKITDKQKPGGKGDETRAVVLADDGC